MPLNMYQGNGRLIMDCVPDICAMSATNALSSKTLPGSLHTIVMHGGNNFIHWLVTLAQQSYHFTILMY